MIELPQVLVQRIDDRQSLAYGGYRFPPNGRKTDGDGTVWQSPRRARWSAGC
jgi:hypothetical protein